MKGKIKNIAKPDFGLYTNYKDKAAKRQGVLTLFLTVAQFIIIVLGIIYLALGDKLLEVFIFVNVSWICLITLPVCIVNAHKIQKLSDQNNYLAKEQTIRKGIIYVCISLIMFTIIAVTALYYLE